MVDYNKLKTFLVVAEHGGITAAARVLHRTPSAVSQQLSGLEDELGLALLCRAPRGVTLTREGRALRKRARVALEQVDLAVQELCEPGGGSRGMLRFGTISEFAAETLAPLLGAFRRAHPEVELRTKVGSNAEVEQWLLDDEVDIGLLVTFRHGKRFRRLPGAEVQCGVVTTPGYRRTHGPLDTCRRIAAADVVDLSESGAWLRTWLRKNKTSQRRLAALRPAVVVPSHAAIKNVVLEGVGIGLVPLSTVAPELAAGRLVHLMPRARPVTVGAELAIPEHGQGRPLVEAFMEIL